MEGMEEKLSSILANPQMMQQIISMAQALGSSPPPQQTQPPQQAQPVPAGPDPAAIGRMLSIVQGAQIDANQRSLLKALEPYLTRDRLSRLERAMRAAKLAGLASSFLGGGIHV